MFVVCDSFFPFAMLWLGRCVFVVVIILYKTVFMPSRVFKGLMKRRVWACMHILRLCLKTIKSKFSIYHNYITNHTGKSESGASEIDGEMAVLVDSEKYFTGKKKKKTRKQNKPKKRIILHDFNAFIIFFVFIYLNKTFFNPVLGLSCTSGVRGHNKMAPSKKKHASSQPRIIPGGFAGITWQN